MQSFKSVIFIGPSKISTDNYHAVKSIQGCVLYGVHGLDYGFIVFCEQNITRGGYKSLTNFEKNTGVQQVDKKSLSTAIMY